MFGGACGGAGGSGIGTGIGVGSGIPCGVPCGLPGKSTCVNSVGGPASGVDAGVRESGALDVGLAAAAVVAAAPPVDEPVLAPLSGLAAAAPVLPEGAPAAGAAAVPFPLLLLAE